ncbi:MAG: hypothetical protein FWG38_01650 [Defluviitaleaceae bacterium]|nr:hypothetical protein [Defluviitaleaceae bacterium]
MVEITHKNGKTVSGATCDRCGWGYEWERFVPIGCIEEILVDLGWRAGKAHLCPECKPKKEAPSYPAR